MYAGDVWKLKGLIGERPGPAAHKSTSVGGHQFG